MRKVIIYLYKVLLFLCYFIPVNIYAQIGIPYYRNYSHKEYTKEFEAFPQNWAIVQDKRGVMYFANNFGVLEYDGVKWRLIELTSNNGAKSFAIDSNDVIYVGGEGEIGYLCPDVLGKMQYISLLPHIDEKYKKFAETWRTHALNGHIYFNAYRTLFRWDHKEFKIWNQENGLYPSWVIGNDFYAYQADIGIVKMTNDSITMVYSKDNFDNNRVSVMLSINSKKILFGTHSKGLYLLNNNSDLIEPLQTHANHYFYQSLLYASEVVSSNRIVLGTIFGGAAVIDTNGNLIELLNKETGLQDETVHYILKDKQQGIWLALNNGITRSEISSPLTIFNNQTGLEGTVESAIRHDGIIYVATSQGLYSLQEKLQAENYKNYFKHIEDIKCQAWDLLSYQCIKNPNESILLVSSDNGVYQMADNRFILINKAIHSFVLYQSKLYPEIVFVGRAGGLTGLCYENKQWVIKDTMNLENDEIRSIEEDTQGNLWVGTWNRQLIKIKISFNSQLHKSNKSPALFIGDKQYYNVSHGLPDSHVNIEKSKRGLAFLTNKGIYKLNNNTSDNIVFLPDSSYGFQFADGSRNVNIFKEDNNGNIWMGNYFENHIEIGVAYLNKDKSYTWTTNLFNRIPRQIINVVYPDQDNVVWIGGSEGLIRYDGDINFKHDIEFTSLIRKVIAGKDSVIFWGTYYEQGPDNRITSLMQTEILKPILAYNLNSLRFEFATPSFDNENANLYSFFLEEFDDGWSQWASKTEKEYTNLSEGQYKFHVKTKNIYEHISQDAVYEFRVLPPWYRTIAAFAGYFAMLVLVVFGSVKLYSKHLKEENIRLEKIVDERTIEIRKQKDDIEQKSEQLGIAYKEITEKNKDITDSIKYAKQIQNAILPTTEEFKKVFNASFILYKPKDIVSGDFYWFHTVNNCVFIAAADCTGHGVPGAFMSMIGNDLLNKIVIEKEVSNPAQILNNLHEDVRFALRQARENASRDGMDIILCKIDFASKKIEYAGANRSLFIIRKKKDKEVLPDEKELIEIKADKYAIGGYQKEQKRIFTNHELQLTAGDMLYMFSDGYIDQFGGLFNKKYSTKRFKELILSLQNYDGYKQAQVLENEFETWKGKYEQIDDVMVLGIRL